MKPDSNSSPVQAQATSTTERYARQTRFGPIGLQGQAKLLGSTCLIVGCGALGSVQCNLLARAGVGRIRLVDRDFVDLTNLQRQDLFVESDAAAGIPKSIAAARELRRINSDIAIEPIVADFTPGNALALAAGADLILDGTDNFEARFLINDVACKLQIPWVFGGCVGADGQTMTIVPGRTPCLRCLMPDGPPPVGTMATCDSAGIVNAASHLIASLQACEAIKWFSGNAESLNRCLMAVDLWDQTFRQLDVSALNESRNCPCCDRRTFEWLEGSRGSHAAVLCGRNAVQISPADRLTVSLLELSVKLRDLGRVAYNEYLLRFHTGEMTVTIFEDGRAIVQGTEDIAAAKSLCARLLGS